MAEISDQGRERERETGKRRSRFFPLRRRRMTWDRGGGSNQLSPPPPSPFSQNLVPALLFFREFESFSFLSSFLSSPSDSVNELAVAKKRRRRRAAGPFRMGRADGRKRGERCIEDEKCNRVSTDGGKGGGGERVASLDEAAHGRKR